MAVTIGQPVRTGPRTWRVSWSSDLVTPTFHVYRNGGLVAVTGERSMSFTVDEGESLMLEVRDDGGGPSPYFAERVTVRWEREAGSASYRVEELVSAVWTERATVREDGRQYFQFVSRVLEDDTTHSFRVVAVGVNGNESTATQLSVLMVRRPDPPSLGFAYDGGTQRVTITAA